MAMSENLYTVWTFTGLQAIDMGTQTEVVLSPDFSLLKTNPLLLSARSLFDLNRHQNREMENCTWFLVHRVPQSPIRDVERSRNIEALQDALMAFQIVKPIETYGFIFQGIEFEKDKVNWERIVQRWPMSSGPWARLRIFDQDLLVQAKSMLGRIQAVMAGSNIAKKNAVHLLQLALEHPHPYIACLLAVTGMEAIFDSENRRDFEKKLCEHLGELNPVFPDWNSPSFAPPKYTVKELAIHLYVLRSKLAHGVDLTKAAQDKNSPVDLLDIKEYIPEHEPVRYAMLLGESAIYLLGQVLQKVL
jgi:hypothetical protein